MNNSRFHLHLPWQNEPAEFKQKYLQNSAMEFLFWFSMACTGYLVVFLKAQGLTATTCSVITGVCSIVAIFSTPFWGAVSDKIRSVRRVFLLCLAVGSVVWAFIPLASRLTGGSLVVIIALVILTNFFRAPISSLMDNWVVQACYSNRLNYGSVRSWGSFSFAIMGVALSIILPKLGSDVSLTFYLSLITAIPLFWICFRVKDDVQKGKSIPLKELHVGRLLKNGRYLTFLAFVALMQLSVSTAINLLPFLVSSVGGDASQMGLVTGYRALLEIPMLLLLKPLRKKVPLYWLLIGCTCFYAIECSLYSLAG
ncbi:MAG: MFS transporter, partial [Eubacteriales bacterium]|nr:MFS transporter [Eubacteriales bacterium]